MQSARRKVSFTYQDYLHLPEDKRYELVEGDLHMVPAPLTKHQKVIGNLYSLLLNFIMKKDRGELLLSPTDVVLSDEDVVQPDLLFIAKKRLAILTEKNVRGAPDLVIEVLSPNTLEWDRQIKRKLYEKYGVSEYWIVDPEGRSVEILTMKTEGLKTYKVFNEKSKLLSPLLKGLSLAVKEFFRNL